MIRLVLFLVGVVAIAAGLAWLADRPGSLVVTWQGYEIETSVFRAVVLLSFMVGVAVLVWSIARQLWTSPATVGRFFMRRRQERGLDALSSGMIAIGAGDKALATRYAVQARKALPNEPLTHLLRAQAAQLSGDRATSRRIFEAMLGSPDTEQLGLRGLFLEAEREGQREAAEQFAARALALNPRLAWSFDALFDLQCKARNWQAALDTLAIGRRNGLVERPDADRRRGVLLTAQAQALEEENAGRALELAQEAHGLAPDLAPAAVIAGRQLASRGNTPKAAKVIERTWKRTPHPDLALVYAHARPGDSPRDRLERVKRLARSTPHSSEGPIAVAQAAIEARDWAEARSALQPLLDGRLSQRVCTLMARIEGGERENSGAVREWLARAVNAPRDPAWTADGIVSETWAAVSPVTGALDAFQWRVPVEVAQAGDADAALAKIEELVGLGAPAPSKVAGPSRVAEDIQPDAAAGPVRPDAVDAAADVPDDARSASREPPAASYSDTARNWRRGEADVSEVVEPVPVGSTEPARPAASGADTKTGVGARTAGTHMGAAPKEVALPVNGARDRLEVALPAGPARAEGPPSKAGAGGTSVFVPPRAPDDPGLEEAVEIGAAVRADYAPPKAKRTT